MKTDHPGEVRQALLLWHKPELSALSDLKGPFFPVTQRALVAVLRQTPHRLLPDWPEIMAEQSGIRQEEQEKAKEIAKECIQLEKIRERSKQLSRLSQYLLYAWQRKLFLLAREVLVARRLIQKMRHLVPEAEPILQWWHDDDMPVTGLALWFAMMLEGLPWPHTNHVVITRDSRHVGFSPAKVRISRPYAIIAAFGWPDARALLRHLARSTSNLSLIILREGGCGFWRQRKPLEKEYRALGGRGKLVWLDVPEQPWHISVNMERAAERALPETSLLSRALSFSEFLESVSTLRHTLEEITGGASPEEVFLADITSISGALTLDIVAPATSITFHAHSAYPLISPLAWPDRILQQGRLILWHPCCWHFPQWRRHPDVVFRPPHWMRSTTRHRLARFLRGLRTGRHGRQVRIGIILTTGHENIAADVDMRRVLDGLATFMWAGARQGASFRVRLREAEDFPLALKAMSRKTWPEGSVIWKRIGEESFARFAASVDVVVEAGEHSSAVLLAIEQGLPVLSMADKKGARHPGILRSVPHLPCKNTWRAFMRLAGSRQRRRHLWRRQYAECTRQATNLVANPF